MEIKIKNKIKVGDQTEIIEEIHTCDRRGFKGTSGPNC